MGTRISIRGEFCVGFLRFLSKGRVYAIVFPVPVCAIPTKSLPEQILENALC